MVTKLLVYFYSFLTKTFYITIRLNIEFHFITTLQILDPIAKIGDQKSRKHYVTRIRSRSDTVARTFVSEIFLDISVADEWAVRDGFLLTGFPFSYFGKRITI